MSCVTKIDQTNNVYEICQKLVTKVMTEQKAKVESLIEAEKHKTAAETQAQNLEEEVQR